METSIKVINDPVLGPSVYGRQLYKLITEPRAVRDTFTDRFRHNQKKLGLIEGKDFYETGSVIPEVHPVKLFMDFVITVDAAIRIARIQTKNRGKAVVDYLTDYQQNPEIATHPPITPPASTQESLFANLTSGYRFADRPTQMPETPLESTINETPGQRALREAQAMIDEENRQKAEEEERQRQAKQQEPEPAPQPTESLPTFEARLSLAEQRVNTLLGFFTQTYQALTELAPIEPEANTEEPAVMTVRGKLIRLVNSYAAAERRSEHETWKYLYGQFDLRYEFNVYAHAPGKGERNYLSIIEKYGQLDNLYHLAKKLFVLPELK
ncbi:hypothetical protein GCM10027592_63290 [Spirosoma flavus]